MIVKRFIMPDPFLINGIRDYRPGDPLRSVHWGATARMGGRLQVKQFDTTSDPRALIILNVQTTEEQWGELMDYEQPVIEQGIRIAATLAMRALSCGVEAGFASNACYQGEKGQGKCIYIPARHSADQAETLFTAMARLQRENVPVSLTLVGNGRWRLKLMGMRDRLGLKNIVHMPGFIPHDQICGYMLDHDMLIMPSVVHSNGDRDGIPNVIMEALSHRMPVIATDVCGISEVIINGETGLLTPQRNPRALADAVRHMVEDREHASRMAEAGRARVEKMFDRENNITALLRLYVDESRHYWSHSGGQTGSSAEDDIPAAMKAGAAGHA